MVLLHNLSRNWIFIDILLKGTLISNVIKTQYAV